MSRKATITADWKRYGVSASLDVEVPNLVTYIKTDCQEITAQGGWIKSPYDTSAYKKEFIFDIESDADDATLQAAIDEGDLWCTGGDISFLYTIQISKGQKCFGITFVYSPEKTLNIFANTTVRSVVIRFQWDYNDTVLETSYTVKIPPFGSDAIFSIPAPSTPDEYYHDIENSLTFTYGSTFSSSDIDQWIKNGSLIFLPEIRHLKYRSSVSVYKDCIMAPYEDWNQDDAEASDYVSASLDTMTITFLKMIYYDGAIASGFSWIDSKKAASNYAVYMIRDVNGFQYTVSQVISQTASTALYYAGGYVEVESNSYENPANDIMALTSAPVAVTTTSSGINFSNGTTTGTNIWPTCWLMLRFGSKAYAKAFVEMVRSHCIEVTMITNGSSAQVIREYYEISVDGVNTDLEIPSGNHNGIQINFGACPSDYTSDNKIPVTAEPGSNGYGSVYYVPLFKWVEYDVLNASSATSLGVRLRYSGVGVSGTTQHSSPSYFYPSSEDAIWRILTCY